MSLTKRVFSKSGHAFLRRTAIFHRHLYLHSYCTLSTFNCNQSLFYQTNHINHIDKSCLFYQSQRFKRGAKGRKKLSIYTSLQKQSVKYITKTIINRAKEEDLGRPEVGTTLDTDEYKKRMEKHIFKLQTQLREIQPRTANTCN